MLLSLLGAHIVPALAVAFGPGPGGQAYGGYSGLTSKGSPSLGYAGYSAGAIGGGFGGGVIGGHGSLPYAGLSGGGIGGYGGGVGGYGIGHYGGGIGGYGIGGYGGGIGSYGGGGLGALSSLAIQSSSGLGALPLQSSSSAGFLAFEVAGPQGPQGPPPPPRHHGKHGKHQQVQVVQPIVQEYVQPVAKEVLVEEYYQAEGPILENQVNSYDVETSYAVTHKPVFHKTVYNHITQHDRVNKEVLHHVSESEVRNFEVAGDQIYGGAVEVDHGEIGHAAYGAMIAPQYQPLAAVVQPQYQPFQSASSSSGAMVVQPSYQPQATVAQPHFQPLSGVAQPQYQPFQSASSSSAYQPQQAAVVPAQYQPMAQPRPVVNQDVYHHVNVGTEVRHHTVAGSEQYAGATHVQHGNVGHAGYQNAVANTVPSASSYNTGAFKTAGSGRSGSVVTTNYNPLDNVGAGASHSAGSSTGYPITDRG